MVGEWTSRRKAKASVLNAAYKDWCEQSGERVISKRKFCAALRDKGFEGYTNNGPWFRRDCARRANGSKHGLKAVFPVNRHIHFLAIGANRIFDPFNPLKVAEARKDGQMSGAGVVWPPLLGDQVREAQSSCGCP
jgi:hypothetical protein